MAKSTTFGTWLKTHIERHDSLGVLAAQFYSFKRVIDYRQEELPPNSSFHFKDVKKPSDLYRIIKAAPMFFGSPTNYDRIAYLAARQYSRYRRGLTVDFQVFEPITKETILQGFRGD